jgi:hypothetical protein
VFSPLVLLFQAIELVAARNGIRDHELRADYGGHIGGINPVYGRI